MDHNVKLSHFAYDTNMISSSTVATTVPRTNESKIIVKRGESQSIPWGHSHYQTTNLAKQSHSSSVKSAKIKGTNIPLIKELIVTHSENFYAGLAGRDNPFINALA